MLINFSFQVKHFGCKLQMLLYPLKHSTTSEVAFITPTSKHICLVTLWVSEAKQRFENGARKGFPIILHKQTCPLQPWASTPLWTLLEWRHYRPSCELVIDAQLIPHSSSDCDQHWQKEKQGSHEVNVLLYWESLSHTSSWVHDLWMVGVDASGCSYLSLKSQDI